MRVIRIISASELGEDTTSRIEKVFSRRHEDKLEFDYEIDPSLIGGLLIIDGEQCYDATVRGQLADIKRDLE